MTGEAHRPKKPLRGIRVLLLDDDADVARATQLQLAQRGALVETAADGREGLHILLQRDYDVLVVDLRMPQMDGFEFINEVHGIWPWLGILIVTGFADDEADVLGGLRDIGVTRVFQKPLDIELLTAAVLEEAALKQSRVSMPDARPLDRIQRQLSLLRQFSESAFSANSLHESFSALSKGLGLLLPCSSVGILNTGEDENLLFINSILPVAPGFLGAAEESMRRRFEALSGRPLPKESLDVIHEGEPADEAAPAAISNSFSIPLIVNGSVQGLMTFADAYSNALGREEIAFLYHASAQLSTVLVGLNRMRQFAVRDVLTGLYNRRGLQEQLAWAWSMAQRRRQPVSIMILDVDHFKTLNDTHGHIVGDSILREFAALVQGSVRASDIVARYGGDEIVIVLPDLFEADGRVFGERLLALVRQTIFCKDSHALRLTASAGVACAPVAGENGQTPDILLTQADQALYASKRTGRNKASFWSDITSQPATAKGGPASSAKPSAARAMPAHGHVLVVDDDPVVQKLLRQYLERDGYTAQAEATGDAALAAIERMSGLVDIVLTDLVLKGESGLDLLDKVRNLDDSVVRIVITGHATADNAIACLRRGAYDFVEKPFVPEQLTVVLKRAMEYRRLLIENRRYQIHLEDMVREKSAALTRMLDEVRISYDFTLEALAAMLDAREHQTGQHSLRVARLARILATEMGLGEREITDIGHGALLHDIGKIAIPDNILLKPGRLTDPEREVMKKHAEIGYSILRSSSFLGTAAEIVYAHQERFDGSGYPRGLKGEEIPLGARIFAVVEHRWMYDRFYSWENILRRVPVGVGQAVAFLEFNLLYRKYGKITCHLGKAFGMRRLAKLAKAIAYPGHTLRTWLEGRMPEINIAQLGRQEG